MVITDKKHNKRQFCPANPFIDFNIGYATLPTYITKVKKKGIEQEKQDLGNKLGNNRYQEVTQIVLATT